VRYRIDCEYRLELAEAVREHHCELRLTPLDNACQSLVASGVTTAPETAVSHHMDAFGNRVDSFAVIHAHDRLAVDVRAVVETRLSNPFDYAPVAVGRERDWLERAIAAEPRLLDFVLHRSPDTPGPEQVRAIFAEAPVFDGRKSLLEVATAARDWITARLELADRGADPRPPLAEIWAEERGDARDMAHALVTLVRSWGVPARYVVGHQGVDEEAPPAAALHAWTEVLVPGAGWRGLDPSLGLVVNDCYVAVAVGRDASDVPILKRVCQGEHCSGDPQVRLEMSRHEQ
jgi:transglutaminase-like putative cysteine protease